MRRVIILIIRLYQLTLSQVFPPSCRFVPSCSEYMVRAVARYGFKGFLMGIWRLLRCNPFGRSGYDPVP